MISRRDFLKLGVASGAAALATARCAPIRKWFKRAGPSLEAEGIPKYKSPLIIPPAMPMTEGGPGGVDYYEIAVRQFKQQILPQGLPTTTVWSYGSVRHPETFNYPSFTIEAQVDRPVRVKWINGLVDASGNYLPHLLAVDPTLHWANPAGPINMRPSFRTEPEAYKGPVPIVTHVHGAHTDEFSDGYAEAWFLPAAQNLGSYISSGEWYEKFKGQSKQALGVDWEPGSAVFQYPNQQRPSALWYHDHTLGMTRLNVYAGPAGFYLLRGGEADLPAGVLPGPAPALGDTAGLAYYEIPLAIQDRSFNADGSLFYPDSREQFDEFGGPYIPSSDISPIFNPEFFGNTMVVNGRTWPTLAVEQRRYRFRILDGCNSRFLILKLSNDLTFWVIGVEGGFLRTPIERKTLLMSPAERMDVIVDFSKIPVGTEIMLLNLGPDEPYKGFNPDGTLTDGEGGSLEPAESETTGQVMKFVVGPIQGTDTSVPPERLTLPAYQPLESEVRVRQLGLGEADSDMLEDVGPREAYLGTLDSSGNIVHHEWMDPVTENPGLGDTEIWEIHNFTADAHPIHLHEVMFEVINREKKDTGEVRPPEAWESASKDTVTAYPGEITRLKAKFDIPGRFVWHCHIVEHEDNEMMRPLQVGD